MSQPNKVCKYFRQGKCTNGDDCKFVHDKEVCRFFANGNCEKGGACQFSHAIASETHLQVGQISQPNTVCKFFLQGKCTNGDDCKFVHEMIPQIDALKVNDKKAVLAMLVDRSGSMSSMGSEVSSGCNEYLDTQRESDGENGTSTHVLFSVFDTQYDLVRNAPLKDQPTVTDADVTPRNMTALFDSIALLIADTIKAINEMKEQPSQVGVFILTDGAENASQKWSKDAIAKQIKFLEAAPHNWQFYFAAANQDAMSTGSSIGMSTDRCMTYGYDKVHMKAAFKASSSAFSRQKRSMPSAYTTEERSSCSKGY